MSPFAELRREMDRLFDGYSNADRGWSRPSAYPALNVWEDDEHLYAEAEVPGVSMEDLEIYVMGNELTLKGHRKPLEDKDVTCHRQERGTGPFSRTVTLPIEVDFDKVQAKLCNGVLTISMPKTEAARPKKITIKTS